MAVSALEPELQLAQLAFAGMPDFFVGLVAVARAHAVAAAVAAAAGSLASVEVSFVAAERIVEWVPEPAEEFLAAVDCLDFVQGSAEGLDFADAGLPFWIAVAFVRDGQAVLAGLEDRAVPGYFAGSWHEPSPNAAAAAAAAVVVGAVAAAVAAAFVADGFVEPRVLAVGARSSAAALNAEAAGLVQFECRDAVAVAAAAAVVAAAAVASAVASAAAFAVRSYRAFHRLAACS